MKQNSCGLSSQQAAQRLLENGENKLTGKKQNSVAAMFFSQFKDLMIIILAVATVISVLMGEGTEAITIIAIVLLNAGLGFLQEYRTEKTLEALKEMSAPTAKVYRDGEVRQLSAREIVQGDLIVLEAGDKIPADCEITSAVQLACDEAMLTGESAAVQKHEGSKAFMGCIVTNGHGEAQVTATGMATEMGKIAHLVNTAEEEPTPLQLKLKQLGKFVAIACVTICLAVGFLGFLQGNDFLQMLLTGISLAVAAIPEGLPAIVTITLALSVGRVLKKGAVIRRLHAVETLGCAKIICTDKTGTITQNKMTVKQIYTNNSITEISGDGYSINGGASVKKLNAEESLLLTCGVLCTGAKIKQMGDQFAVSGDPTETALLVAAAKCGFTAQSLARQYSKTNENPFDSRRKLMSVEMTGKNGRQLFCKGAPDVLLSKCTAVMAQGSVRPITRQDKEQIDAVMKKMADNALRVLGFAVSGTPQKGEQDMVFIGLMAMLDPPRPEVKGAVRLCKGAGIKPVMITGDYKITALAIAKQVGIYKAGDLILDGNEIDLLSDDELMQKAMKTSVFARVSPAHKLRIVRAYKAAGNVVAMTGDGVNDAPAVKEADIGIAMGISGTDVTKEASGVVILDDNFATIVSAVEEGRVIYQNIRRFIRFLLTSNLGEVLSMLFGMLLGLPVSLLPIQILLVNLLTDGLPAVALGMEPPGENIMRRMPRPKEEGIFARGLLRTILIRGTMLGIASSSVFWAVLNIGEAVEVARSACFLTIVMSQMLHIFECRGGGFNIKGNKWLMAAVLASVFFAGAFCYLPLAQSVFQTASVSGMPFVFVVAASLAGPVIMAIGRKLFKK